MNISYNWLKRYLPITDDANTVASILTSIGLEVGTVETVQTIKGGLQGLVVGEVVTCVPHPNSDHLHITTTRISQEQEPLQIVCGAPNVAVGQKVIVATIGTTLYQGDESMTIKRGKIRGVESLGMLCAEDEIGIGTNHDGIMALPQDTPVGMPAREYFHVEDDSLIEVDITPNRSDAACHYGVARDLYAYYKSHGQDMTLTKPDVSAFKIDNHTLPIQVIIDNKEACPRYTGVTVKGVTVHESPAWLKKALNSIGMHSINNVVDVTNFVLHEMGQALHSFDADKIKGNVIHVRNAHEGEKFVTLDGIERTLSSADLMICNAEEPMTIAGVFGGLNSGITNETKNVFLESAYFDPVSIRKTAHRHQLSTDASFRYERGCDPNNTLYVLKRCALLIQEVAGGEVSMDVTDQGQTYFEPWQVTLDISHVNMLIGKTLPKEQIEAILRALEIEIYDQQGDVWHIGVPRYRVDVQRECDVIEDILRIYGYNNVEFPDKVNTSLSYSPKPNPIALQTRISDQLSAQGFNEILNNSLTKISYYDGLAEYPLDTCVKILNPLSQDLGVMRQTLLFGGLESIQRNANRKNTDLKFYEFGNCYHYDKDKVSVRQAKDVHWQFDPLYAYSEEPHLALWITGNKTSQTWVHKEEKCTFYQLHAYVNNILLKLGVDVKRCTLEPLSNHLFSDGLQLLSPNGKNIGMIGVVSDPIRKSFDIDNPIYYADLDWTQLLKLNKQYKPIINDLPKFPEVKRDFALLVDKKTHFADLAKAAHETEKKLLKDVYLFDVYEGKNIEEGKKSYAVSFILQDKDNTLKEHQIENIMQRLQKTFEEKFGAKLR